MLLNIFLLRSFAAPVGLPAASSSDELKKNISSVATWVSKMSALATPLAEKLRLKVSGDVDLLSKWSILEGAPAWIDFWKESQARGGALMALARVKAHYPEADINLLAEGFPETDADGNELKEEEYFNAVKGYDALVADEVNDAKMYDRYDLPKADGEASSSESEVSDEEE
jgi:hypothetical protein